MTESLYNVLIPDGKTLEENVNYTRLIELASNPKNEGALARCVSGDFVMYILQLVKGEWIPRV